MKKWFKLLQGETTMSAQEISGELDNLQFEQKNKEQAIKKLQSELQTEQVKKLAGGGDEKMLDAIAKEIALAKSENEALMSAIQELSISLNKAIEKEKADKIKEIDEKIKKIMTEKKALEDLFLKAAGHAVGLWLQINSTNDNFTAGRNTAPWAMPREETKEFQKAIDNTLDGKQPFSIEIQKLQQQKRGVVETLQDETRKELKQSIKAL
jgi:hypothetical protein